MRLAKNSKTSVVGPAFAYYQSAGDAAKKTANYSVRSDLILIDELQDTCNSAWLEKSSGHGGAPRQRPLFVVDLPRSGTTLVERLLSSHSSVGSVGGEPGFGPLSPQRVATAAVAAPAEVAAVSYKLGQERIFVDKYPENFLYIGFVARCFPDSPIVLVRRHPLDVCFAMFKESFFRYAYSLNDLGCY